MMVSKSMTRLTGSDSLDVVVSCALAGGMQGALAAALSIPDERDNGLLSRFWMMPVHRASALSGILLAEAARTAVATVVITSVGLVLGLRFQAGVLAALLFILIPVLWVSVYALIVIVVALHFQSRAVLTWFSTFSLGAVFGSSGIADGDLPDVDATAHPLSTVVADDRGMRALTREGFAAWPLLWTFVWIAGIGLFAGMSAVRSYRTAAQSGGWTV